MRLKLFDSSAGDPDFTPFQFYDSAIKALATTAENLLKSQFQFYDSAIKAASTSNPTLRNACFNSTIVRLKRHCFMHTGDRQ